MKMCPLCNVRKAKRACPAMGKQICTVCCGTKRIVEISCPKDCVYLASSRAHPPAVIQRQQEMDRAILVPLLHGLSERQGRVFLMLAAVTARHQSDVLHRLVDEDIEQAAAALAATLETSGRGIVYEHRPASLAAARLMGELKALVEDTTKNMGTAIERDAAIALRRIEHAAKTMSTIKPDQNELQEMFKRVLAPPSEAREQSGTPPSEPSSLIIP